MSKCYRCSINLDSNNESVEHIINNFLGGKLKITKVAKGQV
ncbi:MAG: hypothetical protein IPF93_14850 [Saprospiraceae bacterium]|nr:hypothetical protein [Saprospiraceae bacterium]